MPARLGPQFPPMEETHDYGAPYYPSPNAPTSQGKLFRDPKPTAEHRWPRGYNPERRAQAKAVTGSGFEGDDTVRGEYKPEVGYKQREWANDVLARSSADLSPFVEEHTLGSGKTYKSSRIKRFEITDDEYDHPDYGEDSDKGGFWSSNKRHLSVNRAVMSDHPEQTLMHEMGHAHSTFTDPTKRYRTNEEMGKEEGYADVYMAQHWRPGKSTTERPRESDYSPRDWQAQGEPEAFTNAYAATHAAHGLPTPESRAQTRKSRQEAVQVANEQRELHKADARLFTAYDYGTGKGEYYGRDRGSHAPRNADEMTDESYGLGYGNWSAEDKAARARLPVSEEGNIQTRGVSGTEIQRNRVQAGRLPRDWQRRTRFSRPL